MGYVKLGCRGKTFHWHFEKQHLPSEPLKQEMFFYTVKKKEYEMVSTICINNSYWVDSSRSNDAMLVQCDNTVGISSAINETHNVFTYV